MDAVHTLKNLKIFLMVCPSLCTTSGSYGKLWEVGEVMLDKYSEEYRHQCEVRTLIQQRALHGKEWLQKYLANPKLDEKRRGKLMNDIWYQWSMGNRGQEGLWFD
jgi:hypothetical protein